MPIDHSIYFQQQAPDIAGGFERGLKLSDMIRQQRMQDKQISDQQAIQDIYKKNIVTGQDGSISLNKAAVLSDLAKVNPQAALEQKQKFADQDIAAQKKQFEQMDIISRLAGSATDQASYDQAIQMAGQYGIDTTKMPKAYDPNLMKRYQMAALSAKDQLEQQWKGKEFGLKEQELGIRKDEAKGKAADKLAGTTSDLRKERSNLPVTKATAEVSSAYNKIRQAAQNPSAAGDLSLIFGYMKMLDPGSTVREGEFANAQNATGIPERVLNAYNNALKGERLNANQRNDFINQAGGLYKSQLAVQKQVDDQYRAIAQKGGMNPSDVLLNFEAQQLPSQQSRPQTVIQNGHTYTLNPQTGEYE